MKLFKSASERVIGIDVGTHSMKLVELSGSQGSPKLESWSIEPVPIGAFADYTIAQPDVLLRALKRLVDKSNTKAKQVSIGICSSNAITKILSMPQGLSATALEEQVNIEAMHFIPYPIDEVNIDFQLLGPSKTNAHENDVLLVACRRSIVDDYLDLIEDNGLELRYVDIDTYAIERICRSQKIHATNPDEPVVVFDIGVNQSHLIVLDAQRVVYSRHQKIGASQLLRALKKEYELEADDVDNLLLQRKFPASFAKKIKAPFVEILSQEINRSLQFFYSSSQFSSVNTILLTGGIACIPELVSDIEKKLKIKTAQLKPFENVYVPNNEKKRIQHVQQSLALAHGLALKGLT